MTVESLGKQITMTIELPQKKVTIYFSFFIVFRLILVYMKTFDVVRIINKYDN